MDGNVGSVFSKENPFARNARSRAFYNPSLEVKGISKEKNIILQPECEKKSEQPASTGHAMALMNAIEESLNSDLQYIGVVDNESGSSKYDESWSSTLPSFQETPVKDVEETKAKQKEHSVEDFLERQGTLSRFVQRFREQPPLPRQAREERSSETTPEFWWLHNQQKFSTITSTPTDQFTDEPSSLSSTPPCSRKNTRNHNMPKRRTSNSSEDVGGMQLRADKLLEISGTTLNNDTSTTLSKISYVKKDIPQNVQENPWEIQKPANTPKTIRYPMKPKRPEDDILYQWRLARKMEMAAESVNKPFRSLAANLMNKRDHGHKNVLDKERIPGLSKNIDVTKEFAAERKIAPDSTRKELDKAKDDLSSNEATVKECKEVAVGTENRPDSNNKLVVQTNNKVTENNISNLHEEFLRNNPHLVRCGCRNFGTNYCPSCVVHPLVHTVCQGYLQQPVIHQQHSPTKISTTSTGIQVSLPSKSPSPNFSTSQHPTVSKSTKEKKLSTKRVGKAERAYTEDKGSVPVEQTRTKVGVEELKEKANTRNPIINQVIAHHLFPDDSESDKDTADDERPSFTPSPPSCKTSRPATNVEYQKRPTASTPTKADEPTRENEVIDKELKTQTVDDMFEVSSEDEFVDDEILQDLRKRRKDIRQKLREIQNILIP